MFDGWILRYKLWQLKIGLKDLGKDVDLALNCRDALKIAGKSYDDFDRILTELRGQRRTLELRMDTLRAAIDIRKLKPANAIQEISGRCLCRSRRLTQR